MLVVYERSIQQMFRRAHPSRQSCNRVKDDQAHVPLDYACLERLQALQQGGGGVNGINGHLQGGNVNVENQQQRESHT